MFAADILRKEKAVFEQNKAYFCKNSAKIGVLMSYKEIISAYDTAIRLLEERELEKQDGKS